MALFVLCLLIAVIGLILVVLAVAGRRDDAGLPTRRALRAQATRRFTRTQQIQLIGGAAVGLVFALITGWWLLVIVVPIAAIGLPWLLQKGPEEQTIAKLDALESWTRSLAGLLSLIHISEPTRPY